MPDTAAELLGVPRVLVVDDEPTFVGVVVHVLSRAGLEVKSAASGSAALEQMRDNPFDLVMTDHSMPGMSGLELVRELHRSSCSATVLVCSGLITPAVAEEYRRLGVHSFIPKPIHIGQIAQTVTEVLKTKGFELPVTG